MVAQKHKNIKEGSFRPIRKPCGTRANASLRCKNAPAKNLASIVEEIYLIVLHNVGCHLVYNLCFFLLAANLERGLRRRESIAHLLLLETTQQSTLGADAGLLRLCGPPGSCYNRCCNIHLLRAGSWPCASAVLHTEQEQQGKKRDCQGAKATQAGAHWARPHGLEASLAAPHCMQLRSWGPGSRIRLMSHLVLRKGLGFSCWRQTSALSRCTCFDSKCSVFE
jgi:hypothetical protein